MGHRADTLGKVKKDNIKEGYLRHQIYFGFDNRSKKDSVKIPRGGSTRRHSFKKFVCVNTFKQDNTRMDNYCYYS